MKIGALASSYNYYPNTMIGLCVASYADTNTIAQEVDALGLTVVWGPAELISDFDVSYSLMYVAYNANNQEYTVVIRGTNPVSLKSWLTEDFEIDSTKPFNLLAPHAPANALLSKATFDGLTDLISLRDPNTNQSVVEYLAEVKPRYLFVTGHSLGGTLTPPFYAYLNDVLYGGGQVHNMALWSFAGLTPGDRNFAHYFNSLGNAEFPFRIHNPLDIAPFCFWELFNIQNIYDTYGMSWEAAAWEVRDLIDGLFLLAVGKKYTQPLGDQVLPAVFNTAETNWEDQAAYQHHATTYQQLVKQQYPV